MFNDNFWTQTWHCDDNVPLDRFLNESRADLLDQCREHAIGEFSRARIMIRLVCVYDMNEEDRKKIHRDILSDTCSLYMGHDLVTWYEDVSAQLIERAFKNYPFYTLLGVKSLTVTNIKCPLIEAGCYFEAPKEIRNKKAVINVQSTDNECFAWAVMASLFPATTHADRSASYPNPRMINLTGITFPFTLDQLTRFERNNSNIAVNIYTYYKRKDNDVTIIAENGDDDDDNDDADEEGLVNESKEDEYTIRPLRISCKNNSKYCANILYLPPEEPYKIGHFACIRNLQRLLNSQIGNAKKRKYLCDRCMSYFLSKNKYEAHKSVCGRVVLSLASLTNAKNVVARDDLSEKQLLVFVRKIKPDMYEYSVSWEQAEIRHMASDWDIFMWNIRQLLSKRNKFKRCTVVCRNIDVQLLIGPARDTKILFPITDDGRWCIMKRYSKNYDCYKSTKTSCSKFIMFVSANNYEILTNDDPYFNSWDYLQEMLNLQDLCLGNFRVDMFACKSLHSCFWESSLVNGYISLEPIRSPDMIHLLRLADKPEILYISDIEDSDRDRKLIGFPMDKLRVAAMRQPLPNGNFVMLTEDFPNVLRIKDDAGYGYFYDVTIIYPDELRRKHFQIPLNFTDSRFKSNESDVPRQVLHHKLLAFYVSHGIVIEKIHRVLRFDQKPWLSKFAATQSGQPMLDKLFRCGINSFFETDPHETSEMLVPKDWNLASNNFATITNQSNYRTLRIVGDDSLYLERLDESVAWTQMLYTCVALQHLAKFHFYEQYYSALRSNRALLRYLDGERIIISVDSYRCSDFLNNDVYENCFVEYSLNDTDKCTVYEFDQMYDRRTTVNECNILSRLSNNEHSVVHSNKEEAIDFSLKNLKRKYSESHCNDDNDNVMDTDVDVNDFVEVCHTKSNKLG